MSTPLTSIIEIQEGKIMVEKLTDEEKEYYSLVRKAFAALAPFL